MTDDNPEWIVAPPFRDRGESNPPIQLEHFESDDGIVICDPERMGAWISIDDAYVFDLSPDGRERDRRSGGGARA